MAFAELSDLQARRTISSEEETKAEALLDAATAVITLSAGKTDAWAASYDPPAIIKFLTVELVLRSWDNPGGLQSVTEQLGAYSHTERYHENSSGVSGLFLSPAEELLVSRAVHGKTTGSARVESTLTDIFDMTYGS